MGKRARKGGITGAALRVARAAATQRDEEAAQIAQRVYNVAVDIRPSAKLPLIIQAPVQAAAEVAAGLVARAHGLPVTEEEVVDVAAYLCDGFAAMLVEFNVEHYAEWKAAHAE